MQKIALFKAYAKHICQARQCPFAARDSKQLIRIFTVMLFGTIVASILSIPIVLTVAFTLVNGMVIFRRLMKNEQFAKAAGRVADKVKEKSKQLVERGRAKRTEAKIQEAPSLPKVIKEEEAITQKDEMEQPCDAQPQREDNKKDD